MHLLLALISDLLLFASLQVELPHRGRSSAAADEPDDDAMDVDDDDDETQPDDTEGTAGSSQQNPRKRGMHACLVWCCSPGLKALVAPFAGCKRLNVVCPSALQTPEAWSLLWFQSLLCALTDACAPPENSAGVSGLVVPLSCSI